MSALSQEALPRPEQPFKGRVGRTAKDSQSDFPKETMLVIAAISTIAGAALALYLMLGLPSDTFVKSGEVQIVDGNHVLETVRPGGILGEMA